MFRRKETPNLPALSVVDGGAPLEAAGEIKMTTNEVADLTGKEHKNVMRDARKMLTELYGEGGVLRFEHTHRNEQNGQEYNCFLLPKRELMILVTGYSVTMRAALVDRVEQLELERQHPNVVALLRLGRRAGVQAPSSRPSRHQGSTSTTCAGPSSLRRDRAYHQEHEAGGLAAWNPMIQGFSVRHNELDNTMIPLVFSTQDTPGGGAQ